MIVKLDWQSQYKRVSKQLVKKTVERVLKQHKITKAEVSISFVNKNKITKLNEQYMGRIGVTDVLSFPLENEIDPQGIMHLGDIVICWPQLQKQAEDNGRSVEKEIDFLIEHGMLHLLGKHHL